MAQKIMIEFGTKIDTAQTVAAAKKMQQIIQNSSTGTSMKTSAEAQLRTVNEYAKKIEAINNKPKISPNDFNNLKMYTNLMNDSASKIGDIYSKAGASLSAEMSKALTELNELQSKTQAAIKAIKSVYSKNAGVSFENTPEHLKAAQAEIDRLKNSKSGEMAKASGDKTTFLQGENTKKEEAIRVAKETQQIELDIYKQKYSIDLKSFEEYTIEKARIETASTIANKTQKTNVTQKSKEALTKQAKMDIESQIAAIESINKKHISNAGKDNKLAALNIPGVTNGTTATDFIKNKEQNILNTQLANQVKIEKEDMDRVALLKTQKELLDSMIKPLKEQQNIINKNKILTNTQIAEQSATASVDIGVKKENEIQKKELDAQRIKDLHSTAGLDISTKELDLQNASLVKNSEINKIATKDEKANGAVVAEVTTLRKLADDELNKNTNTNANYNKQMENTTLKTKMFGKMTDSLGSTLTRVTSAFYLFYKAQQMVGKAVSTLTTLDDEITQIGIVTNKTGKEIWTNFPMFNKLAMDLSTTTAKYLEGAKIFYQQGLSTTEVIGMVAATTKIAAISEVNFEEASKTLTAAIRGYNMETSQAAAVTDKLAAVGAASAADFHELSVAMEKVSAAAYTAGMSFDSLMGVLAKGIETSREAPEAIGTALKTIIARFQEMKVDPTAELEDGGNANRVEKALKSVGVALRDAHGQFRDFDDVLDDLGGKWDGLTRNQKAYLATMAAGARQQSRFMAIMNNYDRTLELTRISVNSAGAADKQYAIYTDSVTAAKDRLTNAQEALYASFGNSDLVKNFYNIMEQGLTTLNNLNPAFVLMTTLLSALLLKFGYTSVALKIAAVDFKGVKLASWFASIGLKGYTTAVDGVTVASMTATQATMLLNIALGLVIITIGLAILAYTSIQAQHERNAKAIHIEAANAMALAKTDSENANNLKTKTQRYKELRNQLVKTDEEQAEYISLIKEIVDIAPDLVENIDDQGNYILKVGEQLEQKVKDMEKIARDAETAAVAARLASMKAAKWNASVAEGSPGEGTSALSGQMTSMIDENLKANGNKLGMNLSDWNVFFSDNRNSILKAGLEANKTSDEILAELKVEEGKIFKNIDDSQKYNEGAMKIAALNPTLIKMNFVETKKTVASELITLGDVYLQGIEANGEKITNEYKTLNDNLSIAATDKAILGIDVNDFQTQTDAILNEAPVIYDKLQKELESYRQQSGFENGLIQLTNDKKAGKSVNDLQKEIGDFLKDFNIDPSGEIGKTIADSFFNEDELNSVVDKLTNVLTGANTKQKLIDVFKGLSSETKDYFLNMFDYMDDGEAKTKLINAFASAFEDPEVAKKISDAFAILDKTNITKVSEFNKMVADEMAKGSGEAADGLLSILTIATQLDQIELTEFVKNAKTAYDALKKFQDLSIKSSSGVMTLGDALDYITENGIEAANAIREVGGSFFISFSAIYQETRKQLNLLTDSFQTTVDTLETSNINLKTQIEIAQQTIIDGNKNILKSTEEVKLEYAQKIGVVGTGDFNFLKDTNVDEAFKNKIEEAKAEFAISTIALNEASDKYNSELKKMKPGLKIEDATDIVKSLVSKPYTEAINSIKEDLSKIDWGQTGFGASLATDPTSLNNAAAEKDKLNKINEEKAAAVNDLTIAHSNLYTEENNLKNSTLSQINAAKQTIDVNEEQIKINEMLSRTYTDLIANLKEKSLVEQSLNNYQQFMDSVGAINTTLSSLKGYGDIFSQLNEGSLTFLQTVEAIGNNPDLLAAMKVTDTGIEITKEGLLEVVDLKRKEVTANLEGERIKLVAQRDIVKAKLDDTWKLMTQEKQNSLLVISGVDALANASADGTDTILKNKAKIYEADWRIYQIELKTAQNAGRAVQVINKTPIDTTSASSTIDIDTAMAALNKLYDTTDSNVLLTKLNGEISAIDGVIAQWAKTTSEEMLTQASGKAADAAKDEFEKIQGEFDQFYNYLTKLKDIEEQLAVLETKASLTETGGAEDLDLIEKKGKLLAEQVAVTEELNTRRKESLKIAQGEMSNNYGGFISFLDDELIVRWDLINALEITNEEQKAWYDSLIADVSAYGESKDASDEATQSFLDYKKAREDLYNEILDKTVETRQQIYDALVEADQKEIDLLQNKYDKLKKFEDDYLTSIKKSIDEERAARTVANDEADLQQKRRKLATLERDTSGMYAADAEALRTEITTSEQTLRDSKIDKQYDELQKQYTLQQEQRDLEIQALNEQQKLREDAEYYWKQVDTTIKAGPAEIARLLTNTQSYLNLDPALKPRTDAQIQSDAAYLYSVYQRGLGTGERTVVGAILEGAGIVGGKFIDLSTQIENGNAKVISAVTGIQIPSAPSGGNGSGGGSTGGSSTGGSPTFTEGSKEQQIAEIQTFLNTSFGKTLKVDGVAGTNSQTRQAIDNLISGAMQGPDLTTQDRYLLQSAKESNTMSVAVMNAIKKGYRLPSGPNIKSTFQYDKGGLVDYTGPAWVDGTKKDPEAFLDSGATKMMGSFLDYLKNNNLDTLTSGTTNTNSVVIGDINVSLKNPTNASAPDIGKAVRQEILNAYGGRISTSVSKTRGG